MEDLHGKLERLGPHVRKQAAEIVQVLPGLRAGRASCSQAELQPLQVLKKTEVGLHTFNGLEAKISAAVTAGVRARPAAQRLARPAV